ncbi:ubiquitin-like autophagy protein Apg12-domain-containing protein [Apodospora peruviana]|uniref:Ubiquitin-like protein ATG12 n=1 Tax=Apodospora peruviana TaxID=516989 RepID=A0AAE0I0A3_9PEZI|nr:ubiquitin-like autophagy protein Apg12-domain-containing protein [Apodospora peruviana]
MASTQYAAGDDSNNSPPASPVLESRDSPDLPLTMTASTVLMSLPRDATAALAAAGQFPQEKIVVRFRSVGAVPTLRRELVKVVSAHKFEAVVTYLRKALKVQETESVFLYINSTFAPALDEVVGNLWRCFKDSNNQLNVSYSMTPAFG